jgi:hypothetical protein
MADATKRTPWSQVGPDTAVLLLVDQQEGFSAESMSRSTRGRTWLPLPGRRGCWESPRS